MSVDSVHPPPSATKLTLAEALESARETRALVIGSGVIQQAGRVFVEQFPGCQAMITSDESAFAAGGEMVQKALTDAGVICVPPLIFRDPALYAEFRFVEELEANLRQHDAIPVAIGSGTMNDLTKLAAHRTGRTGYLCVATAASMDGYTAFGASITRQGAKQTFNCPAPRAVIADIDIIRKAPPALTASGFADLSAKITAGADWILADALQVEPIDARAWAIVQGGLREALADPAGARAGKESSIAPLVEGLMLGGFAMQWTKTSRPASGAEHQFSHLWDMEHHAHNGEAPSHGFKVGVATLAITRFYEKLLALDLTALDVERCLASWPSVEKAESIARKLFADTEFVETAVTETLAKHVSHADMGAQLERLRIAWPEVRRRLKGQLLPSAEMKRRLDLAGSPTEPEQIGISRERLRASFFRAYHIRRRFTVLDIAVRTATLETLLHGLFGPGAVWSIDREAKGNEIL
jgi:glycerol-1-phosphate dehydrogenase [NAD(P)+]